MTRWWFVLLAMTACEKAPPSKSDRDKELDFWKEAPTPTETDSKRRFVYQPLNVVGYHLAMDLATGQGATMPMTMTGSMDFAFTATAKPRERDVRLAKLMMSTDGSGQKMKMELTNDELVIDFGTNQQRMKRGDKTMLDVDAILDQPFTTVIFGDDSAIGTRGNPKHPFTQMGGDMFGTAFILFPDLPPTEIAVGHSWTFKRTINLGAGTAATEVGYTFEYIGDGACPSGLGTCAVFGFDAGSKNAAQGSGVTTTSYRFAGRVYFDTAKGRIDESRVKLEMNIADATTKTPMTGTFVLKPTR